MPRCAHVSGAWLRSDHDAGSMVAFSIRAVKDVDYAAEV